ncbi:MAG TPA: hypothetical protein VFS43_48080 [Polyangiaceae bacterium]|nr:hypothetical protein [Polyangiaceae bacterium]
MSHEGKGRAAIAPAGGARRGPGASGRRAGARGGLRRLLSPGGWARRLGRWGGEGRAASWAVAALVTATCWGVLWLLKTVMLLDNEGGPLYFADLAWGFLNGRLDLPSTPLGAVDVSPFQGRTYAYWPPLPSIVMMPWVALTGVKGFKMRTFGIAFASLNAGLAYFIISRFVSQLGWARVTLRWRAAAALAYALGTSNVIFGIHAIHWYVGQLVTSTSLLLGLWFGLDRRPHRRGFAALAGGTFFALAMLGRQHLVLAAPLAAYLALSDERFRLWPGPGGPLTGARAALGRGETWLRLLAAAAPYVACLAFTFAYNHARFGNWLENGLSYHNMGERFRGDYTLYGAFNVVYVPRNLYYVFARMPFFHLLDGQTPSMGFCLFVQSPFLIMALRRPPAPDLLPFAIALWAAVLFTWVPILMLMGTGWWQYGARYLYDAVPILALIGLLNLPRWRGPWPGFFAALSVAINVAGVVLIRYQVFY